MQKCLACDKELKGRSDKKFCDSYCKSSYHYTQTKEGKKGLYSQIDRQLKHNRALLKSYNKSGKATVRANILLEQGFNPKFFTHYWKNNKNDVYLFVYEFGFIKRKEHNHDKYILIKWQQYMGEINTY